MSKLRESLYYEAIIGGWAGASLVLAFTHDIMGVAITLLCLTSFLWPLKSSNLMRAGWMSLTLVSILATELLFV